jgi:hypothetical protein
MGVTQFRHISLSVCVCLRDKRSTRSRGFLGLIALQREPLPRSIGQIGNDDLTAFAIRSPEKVVGLPCS